MTKEEFRREFIVKSLNNEYKEIYELLKSCDEEDFHLPRFGSSVSWHIGYICNLLDAIVTSDMRSIRHNRSYYHIHKNNSPYSTENQWKILYQQSKEMTIKNLERTYTEAQRNYEGFPSEFYYDDHRVSPWGPFTGELSAFEYLRKLVFQITEQKGYIRQIISYNRQRSRYLEQAEPYRIFSIPEYGRVIYLHTLIAYLGLDEFNRCSNRPILKNFITGGDIDSLEESCQIRFPASFREFLTITGQNWGDIIFSQAGGEQAQYLRELQDIPGEFISDEIPPENYPKDILIISAEYGGQQIIYFKRSEMYLEDPPIYHSMMVGYEVEEAGVIYLESRLSEHFSDYVNDIAHYKIRQELAKSLAKESL